MENWAFFLGISAAIKNVQDEMPNIVVVNVYEISNYSREKNVIFIYYYANFIMENGANVEGSNEEMKDPVTC